MKLKRFSSAEQIHEANTQRFHVPLHQITGEILHKYTDNHGNSAYLVQQNTENGTPLFSVECMMYQNGVFQHYFITHTTNDDPTHLPHYLSKILSKA